MLRPPLFVAAILAVSGNAFAQERPPEEGLRITVGAGALYAPAYEGDDEYRLSVLPNIQIAYGERFFASVQEGVGYRWINQPAWRVGPIAKVKFSREEDGDQPFAITGDDTNDLHGLGDVDASVEVGGFVEHEIGPVTLSVEARQAATGHEGFVADLGARWSGLGRVLNFPVVWSVGPRVRFVDDAYNAAYFGVTPTQSLASGLASYEAGGGLYSYGLSSTLVLPLTRDRRWAAVMVAGYDQLQGDAADSPLVQQRGAEGQGSIGLFVSRQF